MATGPLSVCFPKPMGRGMSFRIYRLAEKRHRVRGEKRAFAQTITTPGGRDWRGWPGRNGQAGQLGRSRAAHRQHEGAQAEFERETPATSKGAQEFEQGLLFGGFQLFEFLCDVLGLAAVTEDSVEERDRSAVVHET